VVAARGHVRFAPQGLDFEEAMLLALVLGVLMLGRRAFYRPTAILSERFTPVWVAEHRRRDRSWRCGSASSRTGASATPTSCGGPRPARNAPRMLRASLAWSCLGSAYVLLNMLRPARPEPGGRGTRGAGAGARTDRRSDATLANAALTGDKRCCSATPAMPS